MRSYQKDTKQVINNLISFEEQLNEFSQSMDLIGINTTNSYEEAYTNWYELQNKVNIPISVRIYDESLQEYLDVFNTEKITSYEKIHLDILNERLADNKTDWISFSLTNSSDDLVMLYANKASDESLVFFYSFPNEFINKLINNEHNLVLIDDFERLLYSDQKIEVNRLNKIDLEDIKQNNFILSQNYKNLEFLTLIPKDQSLTNVFNFMIYYVVFFMFFYIIFKKYSIKETKNNLKEINSLQNHLKHVQVGNFDRYIDVSEYDEFRMLALAINTMTLEIEKLIERTNKLTALNVESQIKALNTQLSPHFLFNTINSIYYMISFDEEKAKEMLLELGDIFRYISKNKSDSVKFSKDLSMTNQYLSLMRNRFEDRLLYQVHVDEELLNIDVPVFLLQPLIENSIVHGFKSRTEIEIRINAVKREDGIYITVDDNAGGMATQDLEVLIQHLKTGNVLEKSTGLYNLKERLFLFYDNVEFSVMNYNDGLRVLIFIGEENYGL